MGTAPLPDRSELADVLVATYDMLETRFYFDAGSGELVALEMFPDADVDPCELYFQQYATQGNQRIPTSIDVVHGDTRHVLRLDKLDAVADVESTP